jgi:hypothetical protein
LLKRRKSSCQYQIHRDLFRTDLGEKTRKITTVLLFSVWGRILIPPFPSLKAGDESDIPPHEIEE